MRPSSSALAGLLLLVTAVPAVADEEDQSVSFSKMTVDGRTVYVAHDIKPTQYPQIWTGEYSKDPKPITGTWTPTTHDMEACDKAITALLERGHRDPYAAFSSFPNDQVKKDAVYEIGLVQRDFNKYATQYIGIIIDGHRRLVCNFFNFHGPPPGPGVDPNTRYIDVSDGGHAFWQFVYDVKSGVCSDLSINGFWGEKLDK